MPLYLLLNDHSEANTLVNSLRIAADRFDEDAKVCDEGNQPRLAEQFRLQAKDTRTLATRAEELA